MRQKLLLAGLFAVGMIAVVQAQQGGFRGMGNGTMAVSQLVQDKAVQEDLKMTDDQVTKVKEWNKEFMAKANDIRKEKGVEFGGGGGNKGGNKGQFTPPTPEMQEKIAAANAEIHKVSYKELGDILKAEQVSRLKQIDYQVMGVSAFSDTEVASALKLDDSQKISIKGITGDFNKDRGEIMREARGDGTKGGFDKEKTAEATKKVQKVQKEYMAKAIDVLNDEQKKTWKTLIGEPFDVTKLTPAMGGFRNKKD